MGSHEENIPVNTLYLDNLLQSLQESPPGNGQVYDNGYDGSVFTYEQLKETRCALHTAPEPVFAGFVIVEIFFGLIGNILVISTILILREYRKSVTNWYILQLAAADTLFLLTLPFTAHSAIHGTWEFPEGLCKFTEAIKFINYYASIYFLVIMSFDRYLAVTKAFASKDWVTSLRSPLASHLISLFGWILSVLLCIQLYQYSVVDDCKVCAYSFPSDDTGFKLTTTPVDCANGNETACNLESPVSDDGAEPTADTQQYYYYGDYTYDDLIAIYEQYVGKNTIEELAIKANETPNFIPEETVNDINCKHEKWNRVFVVWLFGNFIGAFCLPFLLICFFYAMIITTIMQASTVGNSETQRSYRRRVTMIVLALVLLFAASWFPWYTYQLAKLYGLSLTAIQCRRLQGGVRGVSYLNSALNPYFYSFLGSHFRERMLRASSRVRLPSSFRTRTTSGISFRRRKYSTSNSGGTNRANHMLQVQMQKQENQVYHETFDDAKGSTAQKTERTLV